MTKDEEIEQKPLKESRIESDGIPLGPSEQIEVTLPKGRKGNPREACARLSRERPARVARPPVRDLRCDAPKS